jgi:hypothetical protein
MASLKDVLYQMALFSLMSNDISNRREEVERQNKQHQAWKKAQNLRIQKLNKDHRPKQVFSIHGIKIEAKSRKDAIKIYMFQLKQ